VTSADPRTVYDYSGYARTYHERPGYVRSAILGVLRMAGARAGDRACDIGAGSGHLTEPLLRFGLRVDAVEPVPAMRAIGERRTAGFRDVTWYSGTGESSGRPAGAYSLVTFGSSFDRTDRSAALRETARILAPSGYFACLWNHRVLTDPLQARVEDLIRDLVPGFDYGIRRTDQTKAIMDTGLFEPPVRIAGERVFRLPAEAWCDAWASHATLGEQAGSRFGEVVDAIRALVRGAVGAWIDVPYVTRAWVARRADAGADAR
jgi:SAM-dependent methyltransferase